MSTLRWYKRVLIGLGLVAVIGCAEMSPASAGVQESVFFASPDGSSVTFDVRDVPRREVLARLLTGKVIVVEWLDTAFADEPISGTFEGSSDSVLQRLLAQSNFVAVYDRYGDESQLARLIIVGGASSRSKSPQLPIADLKVPPTAPLQAPPLRQVPGPTDFTPLADPATVHIRPGPPGVVAPPLVPPAGAGAAPPLFVSSTAAGQ